MLVLQRALGILFGFLETMIVIDVVLSWIYKGNNSLVRTIHIFTEPLLAPGRKLQEKLISGLPVDFSPIIAFAILRILESIVNSIA